VRIARLVTVAAVVSVALIASGCSSERAENQLIVSGSTTILPIAEIAAEDFQTANEGTRVLVSGLGSSAGIESVSTGSSDIGTASRDLKTEEESLGLVDTPIAYDGIAVIVNPNNPVEGLTTDQVRAIFAGEITNWKDVGGEDRAIDLVNRDEASGTREAFKKIVMGEDTRFDPTAAVLPGTGQVRDVVGRSLGAVGYISIGFVEPRYTDVRVKSLQIDGVPADEAGVADGTYPVRRVLHFFTKGEPTGLAREYIDYVLSDAVQEGVVRDAGFLPINVGEARPDVDQ